jgi:hypothetical protein
MNYKYINNIILVLLLFIILLNMVSLKEGYDNYSHTVNLPINTKYSCKNMCGPQATCSITGEQCTSDIDCYGCRPTKKKRKNNLNKKNNNVIPFDDNGKLTDMTPSESVLTSDIGTNAYYFENKINSPALNYNKGINTWRETYNQEKLLYDKRYNPSIYFTQFIPDYTATPTLSGEFMIVGPYASNATIL